MGRPCQECDFRTGGGRGQTHDPARLNALLDELVASVDRCVLEHPAVDELVSDLRTIISAIDPVAPDPTVVHDAVHGLRDLRQVLDEVA